MSVAVEHNNNNNVMKDEKKRKRKPSESPDFVFQMLHQQRQRSVLPKIQQAKINCPSLQVE